jgi:hypothetical protein
MMPSEKQFRAVLPLLRARVIDRGPESFTISFGPEYGSSTRIVIKANMDLYDIHDGDVLTLYTEVFYAKPKSTPV